MQIHFQTSTWAPPRRVSLRDSAPPPAREYFGYYRDSWWTFDVPDDLGDFHLVLDGMVLSRSFSATMGDTAIREGQVVFHEPELWAECSRLQRSWFPVGRDREAWDVIVVGTGMGGGTLLYQLAELAGRRAAAGKRELRVLGLEAGPLVLPTHVANLPRRVYQPSGQQASTLWGMYDQLGSQPFTLESSIADSKVSWGGNEIFALGGRSLMWGGLSPRLSVADAQDWPAALIDELDTTWYERAEALMNVGRPVDSAVQAEAVARLRGTPALMGRITAAAPVAVEREAPSSWRVASGMFSTADLLLSARLRVPPDHDEKAEDWPPYIHLSELVTHVEQDEQGVWLVRTTTIPDALPHEYRSKVVVLAAGTVESARIALASGITGPGSPVGVGLTEHDMWWAHFQVPESSRLAQPEDSAKILSIPDAGSVGFAWNLLVEINVDLNEQRLPDRALRQPYLAVDGGNVGGQLVFLCRGPLNDDQRVEVDSGRWPSFNQPDMHTLPGARLHLVPDQGDAPPELQAVAAQVSSILDARPMPGEDRITLHRAARGYVAHEVGTMRMPGPDTGSGQPGTVVSTDLQVRGHDGLFVCDNSVFPACPAANPSLTLSALALRLADHLSALL